MKKEKKSTVSRPKPRDGTQVVRVREGESSSWSGQSQKVQPEFIDDHPHDEPGLPEEKVMEGKIDS